MAALPNYKIKHIRAHRLDGGAWRAVTELIIADAYNVKVLTVERQDGDLVTTVRCTSKESLFTMGRDFYKEMRRSANAKKTRNSCNAQHFAAVYDISPLVKEISSFYNLIAEVG